MSKVVKTSQSMSTYIRVTDFEKHQENPFMPDLIQELTVKQKRRYLKSENGKASMVVIQPDTGEIAAQAQFYEIEEVDDAQFVKIFTNFFAIQQGLSKTGRDMLAYIMTLLKPKQDTVMIRVDQALLFIGSKHRKTYLTGIGNLLEKNVIARTRYDDEFYINPLIMFNGDRVGYAKVFVKKKSKSANPDQMTLFDYTPNASMAATQREWGKISGSNENDETETEA